MLSLATISLTNALLAAGIAWTVMALMTATYGRDHNYPWFPLFLAALFVGFPVVLLVVAIGSRHNPVRPARQTSLFASRQPDNHADR